MAEKTATRYVEGIGRRKSAVARVRLTPDSKNSFVINDKDLDGYFGSDDLKKIVGDALRRENVKTYNVSVKVSGGGTHAQAESIRLGMARALVEEDPTKRTDMKKAGFLKRDPRIVERKKPGLKKARKQAQWSKR